MTIIETTSRSNFLSWTAYSLLTLVCLIISPFYFITVFISKSAEAIILLPVFLIQIIVGILCLRIIIWFIRGKETISIENNKLFVRKSGTFWIEKQKTFELNNLKKLELNKSFYDENSPSIFVHQFARQMYIFKIQNTGRIRLQTIENKRFKFLDNIEDVKALEIIKKIKNEGKIS